MSKICIASDIHLHRWNNFGLHSDTLLPKRLFDQQQVLSQITDIIVKNKVKVFINGGDLFHSVGSIPVEALNIAHQFYNSLDQSKVPCFFVPGNHDMINRIDPEWFHFSTNVFDRVPVTENLDIKIRLIGFNEKIDYDRIKDYDIVVVHQTPIGAKVNNYTFEDGVNWKLLSLQNKMVFFGHIHQREKLADNCFIVGSPMHLNFGDTGTRGVYLIDTDDNSITFLPLKYPEFRTVVSAEEVVDDYNYYRIVGADKKSNLPNVVSMIVPKTFDERLKSEDFESILKEWIVLNNKSEEYFNIVKPILINKSNLGSKIFTGKIVRCSIKDFMSIGEIKYTFKDGFTLITGNNEDKDSNGSGKTSFVDSLFWCLFGETTKGLTGDDVIRRGEKDCQVILDINDAENYYLICRSRERGLSIFKSSLISSNRFEQELTEGLKQNDRQAILNSILGFDKNTFLSSCYFSQENLKALTSFSDAEKTNMITNLLGFETYDDLHDIIVDKINNNGDLQEELKLQKQTVDNEISNNKNKIELLNNELDTMNDWIKDHNTKLEEYKGKITELKASSVTVEEIKIIDFDVKLSGLKEREDKYEIMIEDVSKELDVIRTEKEEFSAEITELEHTLKFNTNQIEELNREINSLNNSHLGSRCDKCGSTIEKHNISLFVEDKNKEIQLLGNSNKDLHNHLTILYGNKKQLEDKLAIFNLNRINYTQVIKEIKNEKNFLILDKMNQDKLIQENQLRKNSIDSQIDNYLSLIRECKNTIADVNNRADKVVRDQKVIIAVLAEQVIESSNIEKDVNNLNSDIEIFNFWKHAFSSKGIRGLLLDRFCNQFNLLVNAYLSSASNGDMSIVVSPTKVLKSGEDRNKLNLEINIDGNTRKYDALSGGEKRRCDVSLCLALNKWLANRHGLKTGVLGLLIFDELFSYLDRQGEENIGAMLHSEGQDKVVLVISHTPELSSYSDSTLNIIKRSGVSSLYS